MAYTEEEIKKYLDILHKYKGGAETAGSYRGCSPTSRGVMGGCNPPTSRGVMGGSNPPKAKCRNCPNTEKFTIDWGQKICNECGVLNGHVLGSFDIKDLERLYYRKKSIYQRKYHYEKKVNEISKRINLTDEEKCELYDNLTKIDNHIMEILNKQYFRKRMININYLTKKLLEEMGYEKYKLIVLKISPQTLEIYEKWWDSYKGLNKINI